MIPTGLKLATAGGLAFIGCATPAHASEGGASFYLLGAGGPGAAEMPPVTGVFFANQIYYYHGSAGAERQFVIGGNLVADIDATIVADFPTLEWIPSTNVLGGTLGIAAIVPVGHASVDVGAVLTGPLGNQFSVSRSDSATVIGDPVVAAQLGWRVGHTAIQTSVTVNVPIGNYREGELANLSFNRWVVDTSLAASWHNPEAGWDLTGKVGLTFNGTNHFTDYNTGTEFHLEASVERLFSHAWSAGLQFYHFEQITGDSGTGATLGPFKGRVSGAGVTAAYNFAAGHTPITLRLQVFQEFGARNRLDNGTAALFTLSLPLHMNLPPGHGG